MSKCHSQFILEKRVKSHFYHGNAANLSAYSKIGRDFDLPA